MLTQESARAIAERFMARHPHPDLAIISLRSHGDCFVVACEARLFIETDRMRFLVGLGPVVIDGAGACHPFLSTHAPAEAAQRWRVLAQENRRRAAAGRPPIQTDTTAHGLSFAAARWVLENAGWGAFAHMRSAAARSRRHTLQSEEHLLPAGGVLRGHADRPLHVRVFFSDAHMQLGDQRAVVCAGEGVDVPGGPWELHNPGSESLKLLLLSEKRR